MNHIGKSSQIQIVLVLAALIAIISAVTTNKPPASGEATQAQVNFAKDVVPILQEKCQSCHRPNNMAPMSLTYRRFTLGQEISGSVC